MICFIFFIMDIIIYNSNNNNHENDIGGNDNNLDTSIEISEEKCPYGRANVSRVINYRSHAAM